MERNRRALESAGWIVRSARDVSCSRLRRHYLGIELGYMFSANGAGSFEPGATPQELMHLKSPALKARFIAVEAQ